MRCFAAQALLPGGWANDVVIEADENGDIGDVRAGATSAGAQVVSGPVVPGMPNVHSHAFQRAIAGAAEGGAAGEDTFWTWRERMYRLVQRLEPDDLEAIATWLYTELLKNGYTAVGEFHYVYHDPTGHHYADIGEMPRRIIAAARRSGIGLTLLPALYAYGGFGRESPSARQRRFILDADAFTALWDELHVQADGQFTVGVAPHSLRAVSPEQLAAVVQHVKARDGGAPVHIHIAEQETEVDACIAWCGTRPVEWLLHHAPVDACWCLVHATHTTEQERDGMLSSGAVVGLCPTTEANLGDGVFPALEWVGRDGPFAIGSDSHVSVDPVEELRWLEYVQRLLLRRRAVLRDGDGTSVGGALYRRAVAGGAQALGRRIGRIAPGFRADLVVLDTRMPAIAAAHGDGVLDRAIFGGVANVIRDVMVGGRWVVRDGHAPHEAEALDAYRSTLNHLADR